MAKRPLARGGSNVRPAPFALTPKAVRRLIDERLPLPAMVAVKLVPLLPIKLVDMPRGGEPVRATKPGRKISRPEVGNQEARSVVESGALPTEGTQLVSPKDCSPCAGSNPAPANPIETTEPADAQVGRASRKGRDRANGSEERSHAARPTESDAEEAAGAPESGTRPAFYSEGAGTARLLRAGRARSRAEAAEAAARRIARAAEIAAAEDQLMSEFAEALARAQARREGSGGEIKRPPPQSDNARLAAAFARKAAARGKPVESAPLQPAASRESCPRCGIPGWKGCDHFLPCVDQWPQTEPELVDGRTTNAKNRTGGRQAVRL